MIYHLNDLLKKMGAPDLRQRNRLEWYYFDKTRNGLAGFAEIRLEAGGEFLVAELKRYREDHVDDDGKRHDIFEENFFLYAERTARPEHYRITRLSFDGEDYGHPTKPIVELGLGVFHARALDISIRMVEQTFNKDDMLEPAATPEPVNDAGKTPASGAPATIRLAPAPAPVVRNLRKNIRRPRRVVEETGLELPAKTAQQEAYGVVVPFRPRAAAFAR
jgi:hypothetical protein